MWLMVALLVLLAVLTLALVYHDFLIVLSIIVAYAVYVRYIDDGPISGYRTNYALRRLRAWSWQRLNPLKLVMPAGLTFLGPETAQYIFVVLPNRTNSALFWTFGVYGGHGWRAVANGLRICYVMPAVLFHIPLLRELLLATGAVADSDAVLRHQISLGRNVAYAPHGMADVLLPLPGQVLVPPSDLFEMATQSASVYIVPVVVHEDAPNALLTHPRLRWLQQRAFDWIGYPWPCIWWPRRGAGRVHVNIGPPMLGADYRGRPHEMQRDFCTAAESIHNTGYDASASGWDWVEHK